MFEKLGEEPEPLARGSTFHEHYEIVRPLGAGGMGVVFEVLDGRTARRRALKVLRLDEPVSAELAMRFRLEATATAEVRSPHVVEVLDAGVDDLTQRPFLVMELLDGESVQQRLARAGRFSAADAVALMDALARGLDDLHAAGVVHRDLKPENMVLARDAAGVETLKLIDFGAVKVLSSSLHTTRALGSPLYISPEALEGDAAIDGRADVYAFGHIVFTLLVGEAYWASVVRDTRGYHAVLARILSNRRLDARGRAARLGVTLPVGFDAWFARAVARRPGDRFDTAGECAAALARVMRGDRLRRRLPSVVVVPLIVVPIAVAWIVLAASVDARAAAVMRSPALSRPPIPAIDDPAPDASERSSAPPLDGSNVSTCPAAPLNARFTADTSRTNGAPSRPSPSLPVRTLASGTSTMVTSNQPGSAGAPTAPVAVPRPPSDPARRR